MSNWFSLLAKFIAGLVVMFFLALWAQVLPQVSWIPLWFYPLASIISLLLFLYLLKRGRVPQASDRLKYLTSIQHHLSIDAIGRDKEVKQLYQCLKEERKPVTIVGIGGLGKTTLLQLFIERYSKSFDHIAYVVTSAIFTNDPERRLDNAESFLNAFIDNPELQKNLNIQIEGKLRPVQQFEQIVAAMSKLSGANLLIIDNAGPVAPRYLALLSGLKNWKVLLSSRDAIPNTVHFELQPLSPEETSFIFWRVYNQGKRKDANLEVILQGIGYHTLTVELVAAYAREKKLNIKDLRTELERRGLRGLDDYDLSVPKSPERIQSLNAHLRETFLLELSKEEKDVMRNLAILPPYGSSFDPALMSEEKLQHYLGRTADRPHFHNVLRGLIRLNWLVDRKGSIWCHPVIAETTKDQLNPNIVQCRVLVEQVINLLTPINNEPRIIRSPYRLLGESVLEGVFLPNKDFQEPDLVVAGLTQALGLLCSSSALGLLEKSVALNKKTVLIREKVLPYSHPELASAYLNLAGSYVELGEFQKGLEYNKKAISILESMPSPKESDLANAYNNLAGNYNEINDFSKSLIYNEKALILWKKTHPNDARLASTYNNLGTSYRGLKQHRKSLEYNLKALAIREKTLSPTDPLLATSYNNLASSYMDLGEYQNSRKYHHKALDIRLKTLPKNHPDIASSYNNLGWTWHHLNDKAQACAYMKKALAILELSLPPNHPRIEMTKKNLSAFMKKR